MRFLDLVALLVAALVVAPKPVKAWQQICIPSIVVGDDGRPTFLTPPRFPAAFLSGTFLPEAGVTRARFAIEVYFLAAGMAFGRSSSAERGTSVLDVETEGSCGVLLAFVTAGRFEGGSLFNQPEETPQCVHIYLPTFLGANLTLPDGPTCKAVRSVAGLMHKI